ncbi:Transcription initiation factor TFIID subunit 9 [Fulvia fulva]|uniref:Transcription initiation factor TFIID subunit 9 n=1 Tax=Passalora fulva TaxID=5499 RepID=A0A9Q8LIW2_PASFU|nr:Transcription initiation factor TFIID subunit 9 [Fulvia fulva]KAK4624515.1 Transcription initiation factor TFIID subunit 9 [Fulvia fulva]KAK4625032.1 Transcription initiation factor TFIID subunit 9 [Fulvia fulva]UJO18205.1 Transcription initiation factor TFIID subunit 9 [Fulvia fulva]WPV14484.1 Transcription initiation factor TFIID subunit 9 [Fulvia fulva]WPV30557.1 Transcription initiation factor TFIID subunit 9 [Fulvia fulva]
MATTNGHPATPPPTTASVSIPDPKPTTTTTLDDSAPISSTQDDGLSRRPRDARLIHLILHAQGLHSYQERVPLQLLDFAYRYTSGVLSDSLRLASEGYANTNESRNKKGAGAGDEGNITVTALRQAIASRMSYTFAGALPKEFMMNEAAERNRVALPKIERGFGMQLPPEKYCLTGVGWGLREEWSDEEDVPIQQDGVRAEEREDEKMGGVDGVEDEDEEGAGRMEDVFGEGDTNMTQD